MTPRIHNDTRNPCHHHHLPRIKREPEVVSSTVLTACHHTTSLAFKRELEVVFFVVQHLCHHHHLPCVQTRAGGGYFRRFDTAPTTATSLASKCKPEVVLFGCFDVTPTTTTSLAFKRELEVVLSGVSTRSPPPPPPSHPNASRR